MSSRHTSPGGPAPRSNAHRRIAGDKQNQSGGKGHAAGGGRSNRSDAVTPTDGAPVRLPAGGRLNFRAGESGRASIPANGNGRERLFARSARVAAALPEQVRGAVARSHLSNDEIEYFRRLLVEKRRELSGAVDHMADEALGRSRSEAAGDLSMMPLHPADIGTDHYEREFTLGLLKTEKATLQEIDEALERIRAGTFGICLGTRQPIAKNRLAARPWARYSIEYKRLVESHGRK